MRTENCVTSDRHREPVPVTARDRESDDSAAPVTGHRTSRTRRRNAWQKSNTARSPTRGWTKIRARIGQGFEKPPAVAHGGDGDAIYHLALAIGDLSPLYIDEDYAKKTRWGTLLAPPIMIQCFDTLRAVGSAGLPEGLPGVHSIWSGSHVRVRAAAEARRPGPLEVVPEGSARGGEQLRRRPHRLSRPTRRCTSNQKDEKLGVRQDTWIRNERHTTKKTGKYGETELATWTLDQIHELWKPYERRRAHRRSQVGRREGRRRAEADAQGPADADRRDRLRVVLRHLPGRQQGRRQPLQASTRS